MSREYRDSPPEWDLKRIADALTELVQHQQIQLLITICATSAVPLSDAEYASLQARIREGIGLTKEVP